MCVWIERYEYECVFSINIAHSFVDFTWFARVIRQNLLDMFLWRNCLRAGLSHRSK